MWRRRRRLRSSEEVGLQGRIVVVLGKILDQGMQDDDEEGEKEAKDHPDVDHFHVGGLGQRGRGGHKQGCNHQHSWKKKLIVDEKPSCSFLNFVRLSLVGNEPMIIKTDKSKRTC